MEKEQQIVQQVYDAQSDEEAEERLIRQYLPYIKSETSKNIHKAAGEEDDEVSIAMFAFHEAVKGYRKEKGTFLAYASLIIKSRLIDYHRKEKRHEGNLSFYMQQGQEENGALLLEKISQSKDEMEEYGERLAAKEEILEFCRQLQDYELNLNDIAENCPKQDRTLKACQQALYYAKGNHALLESFLQSKRVPLKQLAQGAGVERKTLERHRKYVAALLLAYTNGFEVIREHLSQMMPRERRDGI